LGSGTGVSRHASLAEATLKDGRLAYATWLSPKYPGLNLLPHDVSCRVLGGITKDSKWQKRLGSWFYNSKTICAFWEKEYPLSHQDTTTAFAKGLTWDPAKYMDTGFDCMDNDLDGPDDDELDEDDLYDLYGEVRLEA
jgi:hypothetical protein